MAIILGEPVADSSMTVLEFGTELLISAGTVAEALIVATRRNVATEMERLVDGLGFDVVPVTPGTARRIAAAYDRRGKGVHPAGLNFGDFFAYVLARQHSCPLLFVGKDFAQTDLASALS